MGKYKLFKGFLLIGEFNSISEAKKKPQKKMASTTCLVMDTEIRGKY